jgi:hypothetical protein
MGEGVQVKEPTMNPTSWLPNQVGFKFIGVKHDGTRLVCTVEKRDGLHCVKECPVMELAGWLPLGGK